MYKLLLWCLVLPFGLQAQVGFSVLEGADAVFQIPVNGTLFNQAASQGPGYEAPLGSGLHPLFTSSLWMGGLGGQSELHLAGITYCENGSDEFGFCEFYPGPLKTDGTASTSEEMMDAFNQVWVVNKESVDVHIAYFECLNDPDCDVDIAFPDGYEMPQTFETWPAHGAVSEGYAANLAPFVDVDGDELYVPENGDYPDFCGDQAAFLITNDAGLHFESLSAPIGLEIHTMVYVYHDQAPAAQSVFVRQKLINRSDEGLQETFVGVFSDFDIGDYSDDFVGTDVERSMVYAYNGSLLDSQYDDDAPALACIILDGPLANANGEDDEMPYADYERYGPYASGWGDGEVDNERIGLSSGGAIYGSGPVDVQSPVQGSEFYNYLKGLWKTGVPMVHGGFGFDGADPDLIPTRYIFPGNSDPMFDGTNGVDPEDVSEEGWTELSASTFPSDRRMLASMGPFDFDAGEIEIIEYAYVFAQPSQDPDMPLLDLLAAQADVISDYQCTLEEDISTGLINPRQEVAFSIFPNPSQGQVSIQLAKTEDAWYRIFNVQGSLIDEGQLSEVRGVIDLSAQSAGLYLIQIQTKDGLGTKSLLLQ